MLVQKPLQLSEELAAVIGSGPLPRGQVVSKIWEYIRSHNLQNPENRREIVADDQLRRVFGKDKVTMFEMNKHLAGASNVTGLAKRQAATSRRWACPASTNLRDLVGPVTAARRQASCQRHFQSPILCTRTYAGLANYAETWPVGFSDR